MAFLGIFGNFDKPGPGVNKDEPQKTAPVRYFEILFRKFPKLVQLNLIFCIPALVVLACMVALYMSPWHFMLQVPSGLTFIQINVWVMYVVPLPLIALFPFMAGLTLVTRNFVREEHAFLWSDFWAAVKGNWKAFLLNGVVCYFAYLIMSFAMIYYFNGASSEPFMYIPFGLCIVFSSLFLFAQYYLPVMFVTFELKFIQAYKNAFIFALAGFFRNLLFTAFAGGVFFLCFAYVPIMQLTVLLFFAVLLFLVFALFSYSVNFVVYPLINSYLIQPYQQKLEDEKSGEKKEPESFSGLFSTVGQEDVDDEKDKYVYVNGRLVKKSDHHDG